MKDVLIWILTTPRALEDNLFEGSVPSNIWENMTYSANKSVVLYDPMNKFIIVCTSYLLYIRFL